ncbi:MAG: DNA recombination protein RmuC [Candidatus Cryptobacteroides sp.]
MTEFAIAIIVAVAAMALTAGLVYFFGVRKWKRVAELKSLALNEYENKLIAAEKELEGSRVLFDEKLRAAQELSCQKIQDLEKRIEAQKTEADRAMADAKRLAEDAKAELKANYEKTLNEIRENHKEALKQQDDAYQKQREALKAEMVAKTEEILKQRQEELDKKAAETLENITGNLGKDLKEMKNAFEDNKRKNSEDSAAMKERFDNAVRQMAEQTRNIGDKADHLAEAMRGQKKMQGCWGETILQNLLDAEGMAEGRDYDKEETLRDQLGLAVRNEDTSRKMRPDYILHFVDKQDVVVDSKVSLSAFADYIEAESDEARQDASARNLAAFKAQVKNLAKKTYNEYLKPGRSMVDYVIMFVPNYPALQLAYSVDPKLWQWAYEQKVLITSAETLMPFLRSIFLAWRNVEQVKNQQKIINAASNMISRVAEFANSMATLGNKLREAQNAYDAANKKLKNEGQSILVSAHQVLKFGAVSKKHLPETEYYEPVDDTPLIEG